MTTLSVQVAASGDDGWDRTVTNVAFSSGDLAQAMGDFFGITTGFQRFTSVTIANAATISAADLQYSARDDSGGTGFHMKIRGNAADNPSSPTDHTSFTGGTRTTASVTWDNPTFSGTVHSPDISSVVQEIVNRGGWVSGNAMLLYVDDNGSGSSSYRNGQSYDASTSLAPILNVTYTVSTTPRRRALMGVGL